MVNGTAKSAEWFVPPSKDFLGAGRVKFHCVTSLVFFKLPGSFPLWVLSQVRLNQDTRVLLSKGNDVLLKVQLLCVPSL